MKLYLQYSFNYYYFLILETIYTVLYGSREYIPTHFALIGQLDPCLPNQDIIHAENFYRKLCLGPVLPKHLQGFVVKC